MRETIQLLRGIQDLDRALYQVRSERKRLPAERDRRRGRLDDLRHQAAEQDRALADLRARVKEIEDLTTSQRQRVKKLEHEASNARADTALIVAYQHEMRTLRRDIGEAEEEGIELVERLDTLKAQRETLAKEIAQEESDYGEYEGNVRVELEAAETRERELQAERARRLSSAPVDPDVLAQYEKLLEAREGEALAELDNKTCMGCYTAVPSNVYVRLARGTELVICPSCSRILYLP